MSFYSCGHSTLKTRIDQIHMQPREAGRLRPFHCMDCRTATTVKLLDVLKRMRKFAGNRPGSSLIRQQWVDYLLERCARHSESDQFKEIIKCWGEICYFLLEQDRIPDLFSEVKEKVSRAIIKQALRAVASVALSRIELIRSGEPAIEVINFALHRLEKDINAKVADIETSQQLELVFEMVLALNMLQMRMNSPVARLEECYRKWDA